ncbi:hypothetical protein SAMN05421858_1230 [Haladaptatus litoreus]|uniref:CHAT domain-containing protein n=1 Tax=Haladaptatus litoreus TaxID=553468 RepID=A0A1N6XQQ4_9EURY|nr:hypothetical protein [Haladaptatus litoreus]SIR04531.1 hypothetical protein SAMN05421858_1230 [Haladaptatus litoreus]
MTVVDPIQRRQFPIRTSTPVDPTPVDTDGFRFPVDSAAEIVTNRLVLPYVVITHVRTLDGDVVTKVEDFSYEQLPRGEYLIELNAPIRIYLRATSDVTIASSTERMEFDFGTETRVRIGARSYHDQPGATVTTTATPRDAMAAISTFGSALKTTSPERSLPSLRGHPPKIKLGDRLHVPDGLSPPDTGVRIELPSRLSMIFPTSSLAYYLGATVVPADEPRLVTDSGFVHPLDHPQRGFEGEVERVLKQSLFLDCVTRTEGLYRIPLHERRVIERHVDVAFDDLYEKELPEQLETYLDIPFETVEDAIPTWLLSTTVTDEPSNLETIPYLVNALSTISMKEESQRQESVPEARTPIDGFLRGSEVERDVQDERNSGSYVAPVRTDSVERAWLGRGMPVSANKIIKSAFENKLERSSSTGGIDITVVCNEPEMSPEYDSGNTLYGKRDELEFDIDVHRHLSVGELESVLSEPTDFLHYIGHSRDGEFVCRDGGLSTDSIDDVAVDTFLLNGCRSYELGAELINSGSIGGIVTYSEIANKSAITIGRTIARLLNRGFSLRSALTITREQRLVGNQYIVVGDGSIEITQSESGTPFLCYLGTETETEYELRIATYPTVDSGMGSLFTPFIDDIETYFLSGGDIGTFRVDKETLRQFLRLEKIPLVVDGEFVWSTDLDLESI